MTALADLPLLASGKVREIYDVGDELLIVASDRISTYDVVHPGAHSLPTIQQKRTMLWPSPAPQCNVAPE